MATETDAEYVQRRLLFVRGKIDELEKRPSYSIDGISLNLNDLIQQYLAEEKELMLRLAAIPFNFTTVERG